MSRGILFQPGYRPLLSGHETFPLRYGWLKKAYDAVKAGARKKTGLADKAIFTDEGAIAEFGVGKNMVSSMRHWATSVGVIEESEDGTSLSTGTLGDFLFGEEGRDPYLQDPASLWHLHWRLCNGDQRKSKPIKTTWFWAFNHFNSSQFRREDLVEGLVKLAEVRSWTRASRTTIQRDVECFVRMYESHPSGASGSVEDNLESPLGELGLVRGHKGNFNFIRGVKPTLPDGLFTVALDNFWNLQGSKTTLSFEMIAHEPGSPGRVFLLDESELAHRLLSLDEFTNGRFRWSETAGLKQMFRNHALREGERWALFRRDYREHRVKDAA